MSKTPSYATGWYPWLPQTAAELSHRPYAYETVEVCREEWTHPLRVMPYDLDPMMNAVGLWWRPYLPQGEHHV
jgi:hypothetical protein